LKRNSPSKSPTKPVTNSAAKAAKKLSFSKNKNSFTSEKKFLLRGCLS